MDIPEIKTVVEGALKTHFEALQEEQKKTDVLTQEKLAKTEKAVGDAMEAIQKQNEKDAIIEKELKELEKAISRSGNGDKSKEEAAEMEVKRREIFTDFIRKGNSGNATELSEFFTSKAEKDGLEMKALRVNNNPDGGFIVLPEFGGIKVAREFETSPIRAYANVATINTDSVEIVLDDDEADAGWVSEEGSRDETDTPQLRRKVIATHEMYAKPKATQKFLEDAIVDADSWLVGKITDKFARKEANAFVLGDGNGKPRGFMTYVDYANAGVYEVDAIEQFNSTSSGNFTYNLFVDTQAGLKAPYQGNAIWGIPRSALGAVLKVKDGDQRPIFNLDFSKDAMSIGTILGKPVSFFNDMATPAANSLSAVYGDFRAGYTILDRLGVQILRDPYSSKPFVEFYSRKRVGGDVTNYEAIKIAKLG